MANIGVPLRAPTLIFIGWLCTKASHRDESCANNRSQFFQPTLPKSASLYTTFYHFIFVTWSFHWFKVCAPWPRSENGLYPESLDFKISKLLNKLQLFRGFSNQKNHFYPITSLEFTLNYFSVPGYFGFQLIQTVTILNDLYLGSCSDSLNYTYRCHFILSSVPASKTFSDLKSFLIVLIV